MAEFLIDANLPYRFELWNSPQFEHVFDLDDHWSDSQLWDYAKSKEMVIVTKDADFSERLLMSGPPPRVLHICLGNRRLRDLHQILTEVWPEAEQLIQTVSMVRIFDGRLEGIG